MFNPISATRKLAVDTASQVIAQNPIYLDTETTGLNRTDEIVEISVIDDNGLTLFESLVKPIQRIPADTTLVHGITNEDVIGAPSWLIVWTKLRPLLSGRLIVLYNADFDEGMIREANRRSGFPQEKLNTFDLLKLYSQFQGDWDPRRRAYRFYSLAEAGRQCRISLPNAHRATADSLLTRALLHYIADFKG